MFVLTSVLAGILQDFRACVVNANQEHSTIPPQLFDQMFKYLPSLYRFNKELLKDLEKRIHAWSVQLPSAKYRPRERAPVCSVHPHRCPFTWVMSKKCSENCHSKCFQILEARVFAVECFC